MEQEKETQGAVPQAGSSTQLVPLRQQRDFHNAERLYHNSFAQQAENSTLREWLRILYRQRWLIVAVMLLIVPLVAIDAYRGRSIYEATTIIEVSKQNSSLSRDGDFFFYGDLNNTKAEAFIIKSRPVLERTVINTRLAQNPLVYDTEKLSVWAGVRALFGMAEPINEKPPASSIKPEPPVAPAISNAANLSPEEKETLAPFVNMLAGGVRVEPVRDTQLLRISFTHTNPEIAALVANGMADNFIKFNFNTRTERFTTTSDWLEESTLKLKAKVEQAEQKLANYSRANNIFSLEGKENLTTDKLTKLHDEATRAETARLLKQSLYEEVKQGRVAQLPEAFSDPKTAELRKQLNELSVDAAQLGVRLGPRHPRLVEIRQQMETIQAQISENSSTLEEKLKADYERTQRDEDSLKSALDRAKSAAVQQNQAAIQYSILQQDLTTSKSLYTDFLNKTSQANIQRAEQYNNVRLIEPAEEPGGPIGPNRFRRVLSGLVFSLVLGVGLALLLEQLNTKIRNVEDLARLTPFPMLAIIPNLDKQVMAKEEKKQLEAGLGLSLDRATVSDQKDLLGSFNAGAEAYRTLRSSVLLSTAGHAPKTILFTSGEPGDGKTTTVFNTAIAFTQLNESVLIVDCDMRKPRVHKIAQMAKGKGITTLLSSGAELDECIQPTEIPYLSILPCGPVPPNPSELISSDSMRVLLAKLSERYDHVLIDSPPLAMVSDPLILATLVDGVLLIAKSGKSRRDVVRRVCLDLAGVGAKVLGIVLNNFNLKRDGYDYYYYYRYDYDYAEANLDHFEKKSA